MPIRPENVHRYPADWPEIRMRILARAKNRCERCGVRNHAWGWRDTFGVFHETPRQPFLEAGYTKPPFDVACRDGAHIHVIEIVLTIAHLNHQPEDCTDENLEALCQQCHNRLDAASRRAGMRERRHVGQGDLLATAMSL